MGAIFRQPGLPARENAAGDDPQHPRSGTDRPARALGSARNPPGPATDRAAGGGPGILREVDYRYRRRLRAFRLRPGIVPAAKIEAGPRSCEDDTLLLEPQSLLDTRRARQGDAPFGSDDTVPGQAQMGRALPEGGSHETRPARQSCSACDIPVSGDAADGDAGNRVPDPLLALGSRHSGHAVGPGLHVTGAGRVGSRIAAPGAALSGGPWGPCR